MAGMQHRMQHFILALSTALAISICATAPLHKCGMVQLCTQGGLPYTAAWPLARPGLASSTPAEAVTIQCVGGGTVEQGWMNGLQCTLHWNYIEWLTLHYLHLH